VEEVEEEGHFGALLTLGYSNNPVEQEANYSTALALCYRFHWGDICEIAVP